MKPRLVAVYWDDVTGETGKWIHDADIDDWSASCVFRCINVGWLIRDTPEYIVIAARATNVFLEQKHDDEFAQAGDIVRIPRVLVTKIRRLSGL